MLDHDLVLKADELFLAGEIATDGSGERATGLYLRDTRHLSHFAVSVCGTPLERLSARVHDPRRAIVTLTNGLLHLANREVIRPHTVAVREEIVLDATLEVTLTIQNFGPVSVPLMLAIELAADFRDLFDIRGMSRAKRGTCLQPRVIEDGVVLGYRGLDDAVVETEIHFDQAHTLKLLHEELSVDGALVPTLPDLAGTARELSDRDIPGVLAAIDVILAPGSSWSVRMNVIPRPTGGIWLGQAASMPPRPEREPTSFETDDLAFNAFMHRGAIDLNALQTSFPEGSMPAAGIPWFVAPFGRDSLIVGLQTLHQFPERAAGTLRLLGALQGVKERPDRGEEPGKILHEMRYGEMARLGEVPHTPYFGSVDATPLFVLLFAETIAWTADESLFRDLLPNVRRAIEWIERYGDADGDGLVEYRTDAQGLGHIRHQVWKDSWDSLHHRDGRPGEGAVAAVEVQGYVYAAYQRLADVVDRCGETAWANQLRQRASMVRSLVEERFWLSEEGYYAQALDGAKEPVRAISSNPGHLLFCGLPSPERAATVAQRLRRADMSSGWGIRTLSAEAATFNPMSYHNGSIWPHDNSLIAAGLFSYGQAEEGNAIASALFAAGRSDPLLRLPELYCGFSREGPDDDAPVSYPVSCSPQAWAAGAGSLLLRSMLGLAVDVEKERLCVAPALPNWLESVTIRNMCVLGQTVSLTVRRDGGDYEIESDGPVDRRLPEFADSTA
ncbi:MAG: amylo-alpha-1,6-glucosidase [Thermomicrobiales bacterium]